MAYVPKDRVIHEQLYEIFYKSIGLALADARKRFISDLVDSKKFLEENELDIKDAFYTAASDAVMTLAMEDRMDEDGFIDTDFDDFDFEDSLLPIDSEMLHHF